MNKMLGIALIVAITVSSTALFASGSGGSGGDAGGAGFYSNAYDKGKKIFMEQVVCESCPFGDAELDEQAVEKIKTALERNGAIGSNLSYNQRYSVNYYVKKRFKN